MTIQSVCVLNSDYSLINLIHWRRAFALVTKGKAEIVKESEMRIRNTDGSYEFIIPLVIKLVKFVRHVYNAKVSFSKHNVMVRDKNTCSYCGSKHDLTIDHIIPTSKGGLTTWFNCTTSCKSCNWKKGDKLLENTTMVLRRKPYHPSVAQYFANKIEIYGMESLVGSA